MDKELTKLDILKKLSPGTGLREALDDILRGKHGALIVVENNLLDKIIEGGFRINCKFNSKRLAELAKMDGAIVLSSDFRKILYANTLLVPERDISTMETGTRHQSAERTAKQIEGLVIAVSERRGKITIYYKNTKFILQGTGEILRRATETLQILEKQREVFDELINNLNVLEITNLVSADDIYTLLQRWAVINKMSDIINEYIVSLGREGLIVRMRMRELTKDMPEIKDFIVKDYCLKNNKMKQFQELGFEGLLDIERVGKILFGDNVNKKISPRGYRILNKLKISKEEIENLINKFEYLEEVLNIGEEEDVKDIIKEPNLFMKNINSLKEQIMLGKKV